MAEADNKWYYNPSTGEVMQGKEAGWNDRMGPYDSAEEAKQAISIADSRNDAADAADAAEDNWGKPASWEN